MASYNRSTPELSRFLPRHDQSHKHFDSAVGVSFCFAGRLLRSYEQIRMDSNDHLVISSDPEHPANLICALCRNFYTQGWVGGTGGGTSIKRGSHIFIAPSGVQKELLQPENIFVLQYDSRSYLRKPQNLKPSACTPLFLAAFDRGAGCCIHTHSQWAVLVTLLVEQEAKLNGQDPKGKCFEIEMIEQIKGIPKGRGKQGMLGYFDRLRVPIIENTAQ